MGFSNMAAMFSFKHKKVGIVFTMIFLLVKLVLFYTDGLTDLHSRALNIFLAFSLVIVISSKEKIDDERTQQLRYFSLKVAFSAMLALLILYGYDSVPTSMSSLPIFILVFYLIVFYTTNYFNPSFVFGENENTGGLSIGFLYIFLGAGVIRCFFVILYNLIS